MGSHPEQAGLQGDPGVKREPPGDRNVPYRDRDAASIQESTLDVGPGRGWAAPGGRHPGPLRDKQH